MKSAVTSRQEPKAKTREGRRRGGRRAAATKARNEVWAAAARLAHGEKLAVSSDDDALQGNKCGGLQLAGAPSFKRPSEGVN